MHPMPSSHSPAPAARHIPEDTLHYRIHLPPATPDTPEALAILITEYLYSLLPDGGRNWIWHKDAWELRVVPEGDVQDRRRKFGLLVDKVTHAAAAAVDSDGHAEPSHPASDSWRKLEGRMRIGEAIDDEWLVVYLLTRISAKWPSLVISIRDTDGEFLLIEAADRLPRWLTPDNAENRFWLAGGHFHLIPLRYTSATPRAVPFLEDDDEAAEGRDEGAWLNEDDAVRLVRRSLSGKETETEADTEQGEFRANHLEQDILRRINGYPAALATHHHHTKAYIPHTIAKALSVHPALIQRAVEAFYIRDPAQLRAAGRTTRFPPSPGSAVVLAPVVMTRVAYAQLRGQVFHPPRTFGPEWRVPPPAEGAPEEERRQREEEHRWRDLGVKIVMGFEIMYKEDNRRRGGAGDGAEDGVDERDPAYGRYLANLENAGFFGDNLKGSAGWNKRMQEARKGWVSVRTDSETRTSFAEAVDSALKATMSVEPAQLSVPDTYTEDSESWLQVSPDELDGLLSRSGGAETEPRTADADGEKGDAEAEAQAQSLSELAKKVGQFVEGTGDLEGARFEDELSDDEFMEDSDDESDVERSMDVDPIMTEQQKQDRLQALVPGLKPEEWGRQTQDLGSLTSADKKAVSFATGTKASADRTEKEAQDAALEKARKSRFEPTDYEGHVVESGDETDDEDGEQTMPGWTAYKPKPTNQKKKGPIDPAIYQLSEALRTGKVGPIQGWKDRTEEEDLELSDAEDDVVEGDIDMDQEEEEFLKFARDALGIDEAMWTGLLEERKSRGAYIPGDTEKQSSTPRKIREETVPQTQQEQPSFGPSTQPPSTSPFRPVPQTAPGERNPDLDSFEKVMEAMEAELARAKAHSGTTEPAPKAKGKGKAKATPATRSSATANPLPSLPTEADLDAMDEDDLIAMDRELRAALKSAGISDDEDFGSDEDMDEETRAGLQGLTEDAKGEFKMMKDFLESYKAQAGQSGVVGNLFGRLGGK